MVDQFPKMVEYPIHREPRPRMENAAEFAEKAMLDTKGPYEGDVARENLDDLSVEGLFQRLDQSNRNVREAIQERQRIWRTLSGKLETHSMHMMKADEIYRSIMNPPETDEGPREGFYRG